MKTVAYTLALGALLASSSAYADEAAFKAADANADGLLSTEELMTAVPEATENAFIEADTDSDGSLSYEEFETARVKGVFSKT